ncbi:MAG: Hydratase/decarboxylase [Bradyrhizobium sp.]|nr:Hydratase/decarboxylase [Bradyrhizobium sp.]
MPRPTSRTSAVQLIVGPIALPLANSVVLWRRRGRGQAVPATSQNQTPAKSAFGKEGVAASGSRRTRPGSRIHRGRCLRRAGRHPPDSTLLLEARWPSVDDAYRVTPRVRQLYEAGGARVIGRKIGFTNRTIWPEYGVYAPIWGYVFDRSLHDLTALDTLPLASFSEPRIEPEIVFGLSAAPSAQMDETALSSCIEWVALGFEIVQSNFPG